MLAPPDWYPWRCEGGNINTTTHKSSLRSRLDGCSQGRGSRQRLPSHKEAMQLCCLASQKVLQSTSAWFDPSFAGTVVQVSAGKQGGSRFTG